MAGAIPNSYLFTDLDAIVGDLYSMVTGLGTNAVSAAVNDLGIVSELSVGGDVFSVKQYMVVNANSISTPSIGQLVTVSGVERMIAGFTRSSDDVSYNIDLAEITT
jgi:hypothetical protein